MLNRESADFASRQMEEQNRTIAACELRFLYLFCSIGSDMHLSVRVELKALEVSLEQERARSAVADACTAEVGVHAHESTNFKRFNAAIQAVHAKEISEALISKLQNQIQAMSLESAAMSASSSAEQHGQRMLGDAVNSHHLHAASLSTPQDDPDSALAELWGAGSKISAYRARDSGDGDRQLRSMKSSVQVLQMELADARLQSERSLENEGRLRAQLLRVTSENDAALVMLGQVGSTRLENCGLFVFPFID